MKTTSKLLVVEFKLLTRDRGSLIFGLVFPAVLLLVLGALPGFTEPDPGLGGLRLIEVYTPIVLVLTFAIVGVGSLGAVLATYRKEGVLRRLRVTPVGPARLLMAQFVAHLTLALTGGVLAVAAVMVVHDLRGPESWFGALAGLGLAAATMFAIGLVLGSVVPTPSAANAISPLVWLPLMVFGGLWFPREAMPDTMRAISDLSPAGAAVDAVQHAWFSGVIQGSNLIVLVVTVLVLGLVAVSTFRWD